MVGGRVVCTCWIWFRPISPSLVVAMFFIVKVTGVGLFASVQELFMGIYTVLVAGDS